MKAWIKDNFIISWIDGGRPPRVAPNPAYPDGKDIDASDGKLPRCMTPIPYPTGHKNIGQWLVECEVCGAKTIVTAASRPDDPRSLTIPCKAMEKAQ
jgi:hypothetical protein